LDYIAANWLELVGLVSGLLCVWLLIRENVLTFPIGLIYAVVTVIVVARANLFADVILNLYYVVMNAYGWYFWLYGGRERRKAENLLVGWVPQRQWLGILAVMALGTGLMGWYFATQTSASLPYPDSFTTVASFVAMWMSARKYIESWILWFVIDVVQVALYIIKDIEAYAVLYLVYLGMAVYGWIAWRRHIQSVQLSA
jgi:nicotinamide mononucleotide transporter